MEPKDRIIVALDVDQASKAVELAEKLAPHVGAFKLGLEFFQATLARLATLEYNPGAVQELVSYRRLMDVLDGKLFWDGKFMDIPNTVAGAVRPVASLRVKMLNVHCMGGDVMMRAAEKEMKTMEFSEQRPLLLGVTVLTSLDYDGLAKLTLMESLAALVRTVLEATGWKTEEEAKKEIATAKEGRIRGLVLTLAKLAKESGLDGVICSPKEIDVIREVCGPGFKIVTPGVRPEWASMGDQKRVMTPGEAIRAGADYLVVGRPITKPPEGMTPVDAAKRIAEEIAAVL